jgi:hypothetical protein
MGKATRFTTLLILQTAAAVTNKPADLTAPVEAFLLLLLLLHRLLLLLHRVPPAIFIIAPTAPLVAVLVQLGFHTLVPAAMEIALHLTPVHRAMLMSSQSAVGLATTAHRVIKLAIPVIMDRCLERH